jgi:hypothetical protein
VKAQSKWTVSNLGAMTGREEELAPAGFGINNRGTLSIAAFTDKPRAGGGKPFFPTCYRFE